MNPDIIIIIKLTLCFIEFKNLQMFLPVGPDHIGPVRFCHINTNTAHAVTVEIKWVDYQIITTLQQYLDPSTSWCGTVPTSKFP